MYSATTPFGPFPERPEFTLTVKANGGTVALEVEHTPGVWDVAKSYDADGAHRLDLGSVSFRLVPAGGATFNLFR